MYTKRQIYQYTVPSTKNTIPIFKHTAPKTKYTTKKLCILRLNNAVVTIVSFFHWPPAHVISALQKIFKTHGKIWKTVNIIQFYYFMFEFIILSKTLTKYLSLDFSFLVFLVLVFVKIDPVSGGCCEGMDGFWPLKFWHQNGPVVLTPKV